MLTSFFAFTSWSCRVASHA